MPEDLIARHPPERIASSGRSQVLCGVGCCCCCLHNLGAVVGAFVGGGLRRAAGDPGFDPQIRIPGVHWLFDPLPRTQGIYWFSLLGVIVASIPMVAWLIGFRTLNAFLLNIWWVMLPVFLLLGPAYLFAAWMVAVLWVRSLSEGSLRTHELQALSGALWGAVQGLILGVGIMLLAAGVFVVSEGLTLGGMALVTIFVMVRFFINLSTSTPITRQDLPISRFELERDGQ